MKKIFSVLALFVLLAVLVAPQFALAATTAPGAPAGCTISPANVTRLQKMGGDLANCEADCEFANPVCGLCCLFNGIFTITDWIFAALVALSAVMIVVGAFFILTAGGEPDKVGKGRNYIMFAAIGLLVALFSRAVPGIVRLLGGF